MKKQPITAVAFCLSLLGLFVAYSRLDQLLIEAGAAIPDDIQKILIGSIVILVISSLSAGYKLNGKAERKRKKKQAKKLKKQLRLEYQ